MTNEDRQKAFREDLKNLCKKHDAEMNITDDAEINITDDGRPYSMHSPICIVEMGYNSDAEYYEFEL